MNDTDLAAGFQHDVPGELTGHQNPRLAFVGATFEFQERIAEMNDQLRLAVGHHDLGLGIAVAFGAGQDPDAVDERLEMGGRR